MAVFLLGSARNKAHPPLLSAWREVGIDVSLVTPAGLRARVEPTDIVVARLDVLPTLDGVEPGLLDLLLLERTGIRVVNGARALARAHDKLLTARCLRQAGIPHPLTVPVRRLDDPTPEPPVVVKPRFGSWGKDVFRCDTWAELARVMREIADRAWFRRHGALVQRLVPPRGHDLRLVVAGGEVVGAAERVAAAGEWRTNAALGGSVRPVRPPAAACRLALAAARALGSDFVGVDLLPFGQVDHAVLELNGAVEFRREYSLPGRDVFCDVGRALELPVTRVRPAAPTFGRPRSVARLRSRPRPSGRFEGGTVCDGERRAGR